MGAIKTKDKAEATEIMKEMYWLAWQAAGNPSGMGWMRDNPGATKEDVWKNVTNTADYPGPPLTSPGDFNGDYVFGRMLKLRLSLKEDGTITFTNATPALDYQGWCHKYKTYEALFAAAVVAVKGDA